MTKNKFIIFFVLVLIVAGGYFCYNKFFKKQVAERYITATVEKGMLVVSVSGSGQISTLDQIDIKPKISSEVSAIYVKKGEKVKTGNLIMKLDDRDFQKAVRDAEISLETTKLELEELLSPVDELTLLQAENSLTQAKESKQKAEDNLLKAYEDGFNNVANVFLELPGIMAGLNNILFSYSFSFGQQNIDYYVDAVKAYDEKILQYKTDAYNKYQIARKSYDKNFQDYKLTSRFSEKNVIEFLIEQTYETVRNIAEAVKSANNLIQFYQDKLTERNFKPQNLSDTHLSSLSSYTGKTNSHLSSLLSAQRAIKDYKETIVNAQRTIEEKELSLAKLKAGPDELDIRSKKIAIQQKEDALNTAKENLANCYIYSPSNGLIADIKVKKGDSVSSGTTLMSLVTQQKIAEISFNEVDVAKVKIGQKATLTFDALPDITLTGEVIEIDTVGTINQGVVSYGVKISLATDDKRIKPGMSVTADIIIDVKQNVVLVPNSAVKSQQNVYYVQVMENNVPRFQQVEVGIFNDNMTEIISGVKEGDIVVVSTISPTTSQTQRNQRFQIPGMGTQMRMR